MNPIPVRLQDLGNALEDGQNGMIRWYLDLRSGELVMVSELDDTMEEDETEEMEKNPEVFLYIEPRPSRDGFRVMEDYIETLPEGEARRALDRALQLPKPFRSFKDTLFDFPQEREAWFAFQGQRQREAAIRFLKANNVPWVEASWPEEP